MPCSDSWFVVVDSIEDKSVSGGQYILSLGQWYQVLRPGPMKSGAINSRRNRCVASADTAWVSAVTWDWTYARQLGFQQLKIGCISLIGKERLARCGSIPVIHEQVKFQENDPRRRAGDLSYTLQEDAVAMIDHIRLRDRLHIRVPAELGRWHSDWPIRKLSSRFSSSSAVVMGIV